MSDRLFRCRVLVDGKNRCQFEGDGEAAGEHAREFGHWRCGVCTEFLANDESRTCFRCIAKVRTCLLEIPEHVAMASGVIEHAAYRGVLLVDLLAMVADGSIESPVQSQHPELYAGVEWRNDPLPIVAVLYGIERAWREEFGHGPRMTDATITSCAAYLTEWLHRAATTWEGFDDDAAVLKQLASRLRHTVGVADDPVEGTKCLDCPDVTLVRPYRWPVWPVPDMRRSQDGVRGLDLEGLDDLWHCRSCKRDYTAEEYALALNQRLYEAQGWVPISLAAEVTRRHVRVVWRWVNQPQEDGSRVNVSHDDKGRVVVWMPDVRAIHESTATRQSAKQRTCA